MKLFCCAFILWVSILLPGCSPGGKETSPKSDQAAVVYTNPRYGFQFALPASWRGYSMVDSTWEGRAIAGPKAGRVVETGPLLAIRHPRWTVRKPRQDIPIMIFTLGQWNMVEGEEISLGAAPIGPSELGRNNMYVFGLPARYNYAFPAGFEEVEKILAGRPLKTFPVKE